MASIADAVVIDLEDAVPDSEKSLARVELANFARSQRDALSRVFVRLNAADAPSFAEDVAVVAAFQFAGVVVPKVEGPADLLRVRESFASHCFSSERQPPGMIALCETPLGIMNLAALATRPVVGVLALAFGAEDFAAGLAVPPSNAARAIDFARATLVTAAAAAGVPAIDTPDFETANLDRLRRRARKAKQFGFFAKFAIHPCQLPTLHDVFAPTVEERAWAENVLRTYAATSAAGAGAAKLDGRMIDSATVRVAEALLARASE